MLHRPITWNSPLFAINYLQLATFAAAEQNVHLSFGGENQFWMCMNLTGWAVDV